MGIVNQVSDNETSQIISAITLVDQADVEIIKLNFMGMMVDVSIGQLGGFCTLDFINYMDSKVISQRGLLKKSLILMKAWMTYESSLLGSQLACMATYGMYTLVIYVFNCYSKTDDLSTEIKFFRKFFEVFGNFDWDKHMITIFGPIRILNFYERLRDECGFDINKLALKERMVYFEF